MKVINFVAAYFTLNTSYKKVFTIFQTLFKRDKSERGVNLISIISPFCVFDQLPQKIYICLVSSFSAAVVKRTIFKKICRERTFCSNFIKLGSEILYLFLAERLSFVCLIVLCFVSFVATLSDFGLLFFKPFKKG